MGVAYSLETQVSTDNCVTTPVFQDGSLPLQHTHKHISLLQQATHRQIANHRIQWARNLSSVLSVGGPLQGSTQPHESATRSL